MSSDSPFSTTVPAFQTAFDNTSLSILKDCPRKYYYSIILGWRPKAAAAPLLFGSAWHECIEHFETERAAGASVESALSSSLTLAFELSEGWNLDDPARSRASLLRGLVWYSEEFAHDSIQTFRFPDGKPALEVSFRFELPFSVGGETLLYCGHIDKLALYNGALYAVERKTTKASLSHHFFQRYLFGAQATGYVYAGKVVFHQPVAGAIIEAAQFGVNYARFARTPIHRVNDHLEEWSKDLQYWIRQAYTFASEGYWPHNTESCGKYSGCQFKEVCMKSPATRELILEADFKKDHWNPLRNRNDD